jgi:hypothetical protein
MSDNEPTTFPAVKSIEVKANLCGLMVRRARKSVHPDTSPASARTCMRWWNAASVRVAEFRPLIEHMQSVRDAELVEDATSRGWRLAYVAAVLFGGGTRLGSLSRSTIA